MHSTVIHRQIDRCLRDVVGEEHSELRQSILERATVLSLRSGQTLFEQGAEGDAMFLVVRGRLRVSQRHRDGEFTPVIEIGRNEAIGEIALFADLSRTGTVMAARDSLLLQLSREDFESLSQRWPGFALELSKRVIGRLSRSMLGLPPQTAKATIVTILATHDGVDLERFNLELTRALTAHGTILSLTESNIDEHLRSAGIDDANDPDAYEHMAAWMDDQECRYGFVVCLASTSQSKWTRRFVRLADKVILVGDEKTSETAHELNQLTITDARVDCEFVLLRANRLSIPRDTHKLMASRRISRHHHVCLDDAADIERVARYVTGKSVGLVLAGGGARGFAHIGVIRALREAGVPIDHVGGTSIGSIIGALLAMRLSDEDIYARAKRGFIDDKPLNDYTIPTLALLKGERLDALLKQYFPVDRVEDLSLNYFCVSANLTTEKTVVHDSGTLWQAIRASIALPGVLPPVVSNGELLVDGGVVNNLPVDIMSAKGVGAVVAADCQGGSREFRVDTDQLSSGGRLFRERWLPGGKAESSGPGIFDVIMGASLLGSAQQSTRNMAGADLYINPPLDRIGLLDFKSFETIVETGYTHTVRILEDEDTRAALCS